MGSATRPLALALRDEADPDVPTRRLRGGGQLEDQDAGGPVPDGGMAAAADSKIISAFSSL